MMSQSIDEVRGSLADFIGNRCNNRAFLPKYRVRHFDDFLNRHGFCLVFKVFLQIRQLAGLLVLEVIEFT